MKRYYIFVAALAVFAIVAAVAQSSFGGGVKSDQKLVEKIDKLNSDIQTYADDNRELPTSSQVTVPAGITYAATGPSTYQICATFATANLNQSPQTDPNNDPNIEVGTYINANFHSKGHVCFNGRATLLDIHPVITPRLTPPPAPSASGTIQPAPAKPSGSPYPVNNTDKTTKS